VIFGAATLGACADLVLQSNCIQTAAAYECSIACAVEQKERCGNGTDDKPDENTRPDNCHDDDGHGDIRAHGHSNSHTHAQDNGHTDTAHEHMHDKSGQHLDEACNTHLMPPWRSMPHTLNLLDVFAAASSNESVKLTSVIHPHLLWLLHLPPLTALLMSTTSRQESSV